MEPPKTRHLTILLTDIKGFTDKTSRKSRADILAMLEKHKELVLPVLTGRGGRLVKTIGDAFLMTFESPTDGVLAGVAVQDALRAYNEGRAGDDRIEVRIAINSGEVTLADNDIFGDPVNITARIEGVAEAGEVFFTEAVYLAMNKNEVPSSEVGLLQLKGIPEKIRVYKVKRENPVQAQSAAENAPAHLSAQASGVSASAWASPPAAPSRPSLPRRVGAMLIDLIICGMICGFIWPSHDRTASTYRLPGAAGMEQLHIGRDGVSVQGKSEQIHVGEAGVKVLDKNGDVSVGTSGVQVYGSSGKKAATVKGSWTYTEAHSDSHWHFALIWLVYMVIFFKRYDSTPGGCIFKLAVIRKDGSPMTRHERMTRAVSSLLSAYCLMLGFLWALWEKDGRGWHDLLAGTMVVNSESCPALQRAPKS